MISTKDLEIFRKQFDMDGNGNAKDQELFMALARERLRLRTNKKTCESNPVMKSVCVNKETPLPTQVIGKIISKSVIGYKNGVYVGKIGIAMLTTPLGQKFIIFKEVKGYTQISTLKRLSIWCFDAQQPLKFHRNCKNFYIREAEQIWWRLCFRTDVDLKPLLNIVDGINIRLINKLPHEMNAQVEQTKLISKITNPSIADPRLKKLDKKSAKATKKLKANAKESTKVEADSTQILLAEENVKPVKFLLKKEIEGTSEAEVKIEPDLHPHALIGPEVKPTSHKFRHATVTTRKIFKQKSATIRMESDVMQTCSPSINARKMKTDDSETDMEANDGLAKITTKIKTQNKNKKNSKQTKESRQKSDKTKKKSVAQTEFAEHEKKVVKPQSPITFKAGNFFGKEDFQQSNKPNQYSTLNPSTARGTKSFFGFLDYMYQLENFQKNSIDSSQIKINELEYKKLCLLLNIDVGDAKTFNYQKTALQFEFLKRLKASFTQQQKQTDENTANKQFIGAAQEDIQCRQQFQKEYLQCLMENLKI